MNKIVLTLWLSSLAYTLYSQQTTVQVYTLKDFIKMAEANNLDLQSSELISESAEVDFKQSRNQLLPSLNASYALGLSNGRSIDPYTNDYINQELKYSNAGLFLDAVVFNGFRLQNLLKRDKLSYESAEMKVLENKQNLILNTTLAYLQILNNQALVKLARLRLQTTVQQRERLNTLYVEGVGNPADYTDILGQIVSDKNNLIDLERALRKSIFDMEQLVNNELNDSIVAAEIDSALEPYIFSAEDVYEDALQNMAAFKASRLEMEAAEEGLDAARGFYWPTVSLFGQVATNYSSAAQIYTAVGTQVTETGNYISVDNQTYPVYASTQLFETGNIGFSDQLNQNLSSAVGVSVSIPIFNGFNAKNTVAKQKINLESTRVALENTKLQFKQSIKKAYADMIAARRRHQLLSEQVAAYSDSYLVNETRFKEGVSNFVEYITSKNNLDNAKVNLANAKYEYLLRQKILEYYRGKMDG